MADDNATQEVSEDAVVVPEDPLTPQEAGRAELEEMTGLDESRFMAALSYVGVLVLIPLLTQKEDPFVYFHAKQGLVLLVALTIALIATAWVDVIGSLFFLALIILNLIGLVQALLGRRWKVPIVYQIASRVRI